MTIVPSPPCGQWLPKACSKLLFMNVDKAEAPGKACQFTITGTFSIQTYNIASSLVFMPKSSLLQECVPAEARYLLGVC